MKTRIRNAVFAALLGAASQQAAAIDIMFDYSFDSNDFFTNNPVARANLEAAGAFFSNIIQDDLTAITSGGGNAFTALFTNPATGNSNGIDGLDVPADTLIVFAGGRPIGGSTLGIGGFGGFSASGTQDFLDNATTRGEGPVSAIGTTEFAPWGGSLAFNSNATWYFDPDLSTSNDVVNNDFYSVALHELGHLLGLGTAESWFNDVSGGSFTGTASSTVFGGSVPLQSGGGHWANGTMSTVNGMGMFEAAMDPSIFVGTRKEFTDLDVAGLYDVGWDVQVVPVPAAVWLFGSALMGLVVTARRRSRNQ